MSAPRGGPSPRQSRESECTTEVVPDPVAGDIARNEEVKHVRGGTKDFGFVPIPRRLRYDSEYGFEFTTILNVTFGFASTFSKSRLTGGRSARLME